MHWCNLICWESLNYDEIKSGGDDRVISYFGATTYAINLLSTTCSINNKNDNKDNVMFDNIDKNRRQRGCVPILGLNNNNNHRTTFTMTAKTHDSIGTVIF